ncbi:MAG: ATP-binding protein [Opitutales bacterium]
MFLRKFRGGSLPARLLLFIVLPLLLSVFAFGSYILSKLEENAERQMQKDIELVARAQEGSLSRSLERNRGGTVQETLASALQIGRVYGAYLYNERGEVVASVGRFSLNHQLQSRIMQGVDEDHRGGEYGDMAGQRVYSYFVPLKNSNHRVIGLLQVTRRQSEIQDVINDMRSAALFYLLFAGSIMTGIVLIGYQWALGRSLSRLRRSLVRVREGERKHRASCKGTPEIAEVARAANAMLDSIDTAEKEIDERRTSQINLAKRLKSSEKLAALGEVAAGVAHELGAPISIVDGKAQRALRRSRNAEAVEKYLNEIRQVVRNMEGVVRKLLEFGRTGKSLEREMRADVLMQRAIRNAESAVGHNETPIRLHGPSPGPTFAGDPVRVELALKNLIQNAIQTTTPGKNNIQASWEESGAGVLFSVADSGPGVPAELQEKIFEPFFTTRENQRGRGLGLAIVQQVADEHGGEASVKNSPAGGAYFQLFFPRKPVAIQPS